MSAYLSITLEGYAACPTVLGCDWYSPECRFNIRFYETCGHIVTTAGALFAWCTLRMLTWHMTDLFLEGPHQCTQFVDGIVMHLFLWQRDFIDA